MEPALRSIETLLADVIGLDPRSVGPDAVERAIRRRMKACGIADMAVYHDLTAAARAELEELIEEIAVPESWFFRDPGVFEYLVEYVTGHWLARHHDRSLKVLSLACASGEEAYSAAIALSDAGVRDFTVDGVDIRSSAIAAAREAVYPRNAFRGNDLGFRDRYFTSTEAGHRLTRPLLGAVDFRSGNALSPALFGAQDPFDVVLCRNLMIYVAEPARERLVANVDRLLRDDGLLFAGHAETELLWRGTFVSSRRPQAFAFVKPGPGAADVGVRERAVDKASARTPLAASRTNGLVPTRRPAPAARRRPSVRPPAAAGRGLERARELADAGRVEEAVRLCTEHLTRHGASAAAFFLLAIVHQAQGDVRAAELYLNKAIYLDPNHSEALLCLALLKEKRGDTAAAEVARRRAERARHAASGVSGRRARGRRP